MKPSDNLSANLKRFFNERDLTTNGVATSSGVSQKTIWVCVNGTTVPSVNVANRVASAVGLDASMLTRETFSAKHIGNSRAVGDISHMMMTLNIHQISMLKEIVTALCFTRA